MENRKKALGMGLEQLFNSENIDIDSVEKKIYEETNTDDVIDIKLSDLRPNPYQPRKVFKDEALEELKESIKMHGVFQPIIAKKTIKGYEIIAGERRVRASKLAGLGTIPAIIRNFTDNQMMEIALLENLQREDLNIIEEALAYKNLIETLGLTQEKLAERVGKSRSHVTNILGILRLPREVQKMINDGILSMGHARVLSKLEDREKMIKLAERVSAEKLNVRDLEEISNGEDFERKVKMKKRETTINKDFKFVEDLLRDKLDTKIKIKDKKIEINFNNVADLNRILEILDVKEN